MDKKYIENFKKNIDICALSFVISIWLELALKIFIFHVFDIMFAREYEVLAILVFFIWGFASYKKGRKNCEEDVDEAFDECVDFAEKSEQTAKNAAKGTKKFFEYITSPKTKNIEEYFKKNADKTVSEEKEVNNDTVQASEETANINNEEVVVDDVSTTETIAADTPIEDNIIEDGDLLADEETKTSEDNNESTNTAAAQEEESETPLQIFIATWLVSFVIMVCIYLIAMLICWSHPCAGAMALLICAPIAIGALDAFY